jgi:hypothetical protein
MRFVLTVLYVLVSVLAIGFAALAGQFLVYYWGVPLYPDWRAPLVSPGGVIASSDSVFIGYSAFCRVYKFDFDGNLLAQYYYHGQPISITAGENAVVVHHGTEEWTLEDPAFRIEDPQGTMAEIQRTWWGHPILVVRTPDETKRAEIQPWNVTVFRQLYPAGLSIPLFIVFWGASHELGKWLYKKRLQDARAAEAGQALGGER